MSEWKEYTGSHAEIDEMRNSPHGFIAKNLDISSGILKVLYNQLFLPVWVRVYEQVWHDEYEVDEIYATTTPDWNIPNAEYSFTSFKE